MRDSGAGHLLEHALELLHKVYYWSRLQRVLLTFLCHIEGIPVSEERM